MARFCFKTGIWVILKFRHHTPSYQHGGDDGTAFISRDSRQIVDAILWIVRTGSAWRDLPEGFGSWKSVWRFFNQRNSDGTLDRVLQKLQAAFIDIGAIDEELWCLLVSTG